MSIGIARRIAATLNITSETKIRALNSALLEYIRLTRQSEVTGSPTTSKLMDIRLVTGTSFTVVDHDVILVDDDAAGATVTINLPAAASAKQYPRYIKKLGTTANVVIDANAAETIDGALTATIVMQFAVIMLISDGTNWHIL